MSVISPAMSRPHLVDGVALFDLDQPVAALAYLSALLCPQERARAGQFRFARDRNRYVARRGQLRLRLADAVGERADAVRIATDAYGKPFLPDHPNVHFNLSRSHGWALCVIGGSPIGCDLEWRNPELACPGVAARFFTQQERAALAGLAGAAWRAGFYNCWTRKEAFVKALGQGLSYPLDAFSVSLAPDKPARFTAGGEGWRLSSFEPTRGFQAALVQAARA